MPDAANVKVTDGVNTVGVAQFHNMDNQGLGNSFGVIQGGVAQLLNGNGNVDRQRETYTDNVPGAGIAAGTQQLAMAFSTTTGGAITASATAQANTPAAMSGTVRGTAWKIQAGHTLSIDTGANQEFVFVSSVTATTFTAVFAKSHASGVAINGFIYNQARDASIPDGSALTGIPGSMTYFMNVNSQSGNGGIEAERSASGELDGASGTGTALAAEYEHNSGGPALASGIATGFQFDRGRNLQGKGSQSQAITSTTAGNTSVVFGSAAATNLVQPGGQLVLSGGAVQEVVYITATFVPGSSATVPLQSPVVNSGQTAARFDIFATQGPMLNGFTATGLGLEEDCVFAPSTGLYYVERAADADAMAVTNIVAEHSSLFNGTTFDRWRSSATLGTALVATGTVSPAVTLNAVTANTTGTTVDSGSAHSNWTGVAVATGSPTAGTITLEISMDGTNWVSSTSTNSITAAGNYLVVSTGRAARYGRVSLTGLTGTITLTVNMMAAG